MAPAKNSPATNYNNNANISSTSSSNQNASNSSNNCSPNNNIVASTSAMIAVATASAGTTATTTSTKRKHTGAVPKAMSGGSGGCSSSTAVLPAALPATIVTNANTTTTTVGTSNRAAKRLQHQQHQRKNTEIVAPIRRELKDLNDYLLSTVASTNISSNCSNQQQLPQSNTQKIKTQKLSTNNSNNFNKQQQHHHQQQQQQRFNDTTNCVAAYETEGLHENPRFCYPVRPIPRRNQQVQSQQQQNLTQNTATTTATNLSAHLLNHATTIGVVIPTTPGSAAAAPPPTVANTSTAIAQSNSTLTTIEQQPAQLAAQQSQQQLILVQLQQLIDEPLTAAQTSATSQENSHKFLPQVSHTATAETDVNNLPITVDNALVQRLHLIQQFINLTAKANLGGNRVAAAGAGATTTTPTTSTTTTPTAIHTQRSNKLTKSKMVHEINPNINEHAGVVNSASLEDVALSEMSDNRAQSIQSLHSTDTPTPETSPSYDELQQRLENSQRNIQNIQEQQQQLLRLQSAAKQHLSDMEQLRQHTNTLSFTPNRQNGTADTSAGDAPEYESIEQVHSDMATLVGRMKNLTSFIQNQNELSNLLGDDGPEILAEQEALQRKLESLRLQRDEMKTLVDELQDINRNAEKNVKENRNREHLRDNSRERTPLQQPELVQPIKISKPAPNTERVVPVEYSRVVPIEMLQAAPANRTANNEAEMAALLKQKTADVDTMKAQLKRLKDMMETVNLIEAHTAEGHDAREIGRTPPPTASARVNYDRERTPVPSNFVEDDNDAFISRKVRMLNEVTSDLRAQAESLQAERDRIKALKDEIVRRKEQAAAAAKLGEDALKRHSLTPTPTPLHMRHQEREEAQSDRDHLKAEYEIKKKEFEILCQRLQSEDSNASAANINAEEGTPILHASMRQETHSEADDEADEELNDSDFANSMTTKKYYTAPVQRAATAQCLGTAGNTDAGKMGKCSLDTAYGTSNAATTGAVAAANSTHDGASLEGISLQSGSSRSYSIPPPMPTMSAFSWPGPIPPPLPAAWNPHFYYGAGLPHPPPPPPAYASPHLGALHGHIVLPAPPPIPVPTTAPPSSAECICSATNSAVTVGGTAGTAAGTASSTVSTAAQLNADPMLLQQLVQTQQMLINSVCQCNQMLWHQQREIDGLNNTIHILQDRLLTLTGPSSADLSFNLRSESVPPPTSLPSALPNNLYNGINRAQSEQPVLPFLPAGVGAATQAHFASYRHQQQQHHTQLLQQQHLHQQQHQHQHLYQRQRAGSIVPIAAGGYNYSNETQQQNTSSASTSIYATLNNAAVQQAAPPPQPQPSTAPQFNNETPQSPLSGGNAGPGPIFMHHHNNTIHQNNANLRTQNHYANNLQHHHSNVTSSNTLNNQVPPGNRANNYWDNFRSYSRQNLLSTNSNKSNEEQQHQNQQQQLQQQQQQPYTTHRASLSAVTNPNLHHLSQQQPHNLYHVGDHDSNNNCNNLNFEHSNVTGNSGNNNSNKYMRASQRSRINQLQQQHYQQQQQQQQQNGALNMVHASSNVFQQPTRDFHGNLNWLENEEDDLFEQQQQQHYNIIDNDMPEHATDNFITTATSNMMRNMNLNFGNSPQYQRNKVPAKPPTCRSAANIDSLQPPPPPPQQQRLPRNIDEEFVTMPETQQQQQQHFRHVAGPPTSYPPHQQQRYSLLSAAEHNLRQQPSREHDYLLRTINVSTEEDADFGYSLPSSRHGVASTNSMVADGFTALDEEDDDDDDTTSEEIKRNLLVNALKNDKFTTKFYESIKEDVFRRLESMLLEKENSGNEQRQSESQILLSSQPAYALQLFNDVSNNREGTEFAHTRDPSRKLYLNARMGNQQQQQQLQLQQEQCFALQELQVNVDVDGADVDVDDQEENEQHNNADTESNNADNDGAMGLDEINICRESQKPEDEAEDDNNATATSSDAGAATVRDTDIKAAATANWRRNHVTEMPSIISTNNNGNDKDQGNVVISTATPDYELISYIVTRIRNQTHTNTIINDTMLVEVAKLTATAAQNSAYTQLANANNMPPHISPKKIYAKIKKMSLPRQRDEFLLWYQNYLSTLFIVDGEPHMMEHALLGKRLHQQNSNGLTLNKQKAQKCNLQKKTKDEPVTEIKTTKVDNSQNNGNNNNNNMQINDADLAEADQICTANTLKIGDDVNEKQLSVDNLCISIKNELEEFENNENPEEERSGAGATSVPSPTSSATIAALSASTAKEQDSTDNEENVAPSGQANDIDFNGDFGKRNNSA